MTRIVYLSFPTGAVAGGQKVILRHVEALNRMGFEAIWWRNTDKAELPWLDFDAPTEVGTLFRPDDILVVPSDAPNAIRTLAQSRRRTVIFEQNQFSFLNLGLEQIDAFAPGHAPIFFAVGSINANTIRRVVPGAQVEIVPCFADERVFKPGTNDLPRVAYAPRKRMGEARIIRQFLGKAHPRHVDLPWVEMSNLPEAAVAEILGRSALHLSLPRLESVGMTTLEAMACGCVSAGFMGIGGRQYMTADNGFWVPDDDCEAAADALAEAADVVATGGARLTALRDAGRATADEWSYARFLAKLEEVWERLAPEARRLPTRA
ncbi:hypothetical protein [Caulobacter segnis]|uniref:hypothetical protein n=1 Tax=Caulobacter segnis TaxID=88688 RepID=UPI00285C1DEE|nr:hypothetical protein [Caulobacter segnis]MDR6626996.1 hypothetical protein [Caulobacter segnis]